MKAFLTLIFAFILVLNNLNCQELMKIGEVFDFEISDEFHFSDYGYNKPPNANRITIIDKYYSDNGDTINYIEAHDSYFTNIIWEPEPHLEYHFWTDTINVQYFNLDSSLYYYETGFQYDTSVYISSDYCDSLVNECYYEIGQLDPDYYHKIYGKGLGLVYTILPGTGSPPLADAIGLFYYKKNGIECGTPDTTMIGIKNDYKESTRFEIYPNPTKSKVFIRANNSIKSFELFLINSRGRQIYNHALFGDKNEINVKSLERGIYFLKIINGREIQTFKIIKD